MDKHELQHDPLQTLEDIMTTDEDSKARVAAAKALAEYVHQKKPHAGTGAEAQEVNITMHIGDGKRVSKCLPST